MGTPNGSDRPTYSRNVGSNSIANEEQFGLANTNTRKDRKVESILNPKNSTRTCADPTGAPVTAIVVASDFTESRGDDIKIIDQKIPMLIGQILMKGYVPNPMISFAGLGDATSDLAPIQVGNFYNNDKIDEVLSHMWIERGGGGTGQESYELMAYYYAYHSVINNPGTDEKGFFFFIGDEGFYPKVSAREVKKIIGDDLPADLDAAAVFADLQEKYNVFFIYPQQAPEVRKKNIDKEIEQRVKKAGGMYDGVDIRLSLKWDTYDDLDAHCITPAGEEIFFRTPTSACGGKLDVDRNAGKRETREPVENIRWPKGSAPRGHYRFFVRNYDYHEDRIADVAFLLEAEINGKISHYNGKTKRGETGPSSDVTVVEFDYDPAGRQVDGNMYTNYEDQVIMSQWSKVIPKENILILKNPKAIVDTILCVLALYGGRTMEGYVDDMKEREQTLERQEEVRGTCSGVADNIIPTATTEGSLPM